MGRLQSVIDTAVNEEDRTIELTWSTGFKGLRQNWDGFSYYEELSMDPKHVDMSRLQAGAPLLDAHNSYSNSAVIGVVERATLENGVGKAVVRFSKDPEADKIYQKVREGVLKNVSVGYQVRKYEDVSQKGDSTPTYRATNWQPHEISIVPIGFDPHAQVRKQEDGCEVEIEVSSQELNPEPQSAQTNIEPEAQKDRTMTEAEKLALEQAAKKAAAQEEKKRQAEIRKLVRSLKLEESYADELISNDVTVEEAAKMVVEKRAAKDTEPVQTGASTPDVQISSKNEEMRRKGFEDSLLNKIDSRNFKLTEEAKPFYGRSLLSRVELIVPRHSMESDAAYAKRAMSSSDLPLALANVAEKGLQKSYELQPRTFERWTRQDTLRNYKEFSQVKGGDYSSLLERKENAPYAMGSTSEKNEVAQLKDFGIMHSFSSQMLVNDDMGVLQRLASQAGIAVARLENKKAYAALTTNKTMKDSIALYHASHGNLGTAGAISASTIGELYKFMRKQTTTGALDPLNLTPKYFICGPDQEVAARQFFASIIPNQTSNVNIFQGSMEVVVDAEITGNQYYIAADPSVIDTVVCYRLEGQEQPKIESRLNWSNDALELKVAHAFDAQPMDWRGLGKNAGQ